MLSLCFSKVQTQQEVATALGVHQTTVYRLQGRLVRFGNTNDRSRSSHPRVTTARQDCLMRLTHRHNRTRTAVETAITTPGTHNHRISAQTVHNTQRIWYQSISSTCWKSTYSSPTTCAHAMVEGP